MPKPRPEAPAAEQMYEAPTLASDFGNLDTFYTPDDPDTVLDLARDLRERQSGDVSDAQLLAGAILTLAAEVRQVVKLHANTMSVIAGERINYETYDQ